VPAVRKHNACLIRPMRALRRSLERKRRASRKRISILPSRLYSFEPAYDDSYRHERWCVPAGMAGWWNGCDVGGSLGVASVRRKTEFINIRAASILAVDYLCVPAHR